MRWRCGGLLEPGSADDEPGASAAPPPGRSVDAAGTACGVGKRQMPFCTPNKGARDIPAPFALFAEQPVVATKASKPSVLRARTTESTQGVSHCFPAYVPPTLQR
jgi:hypothetical protein